MIHCRILLSVSLLLLASATAQAENQRLTVDRLYSLPSLIGTAPEGFAWSADGRHLAFLWNDEGRPFRDVWVLDTQSPDLRPVRRTRMPLRAGDEEIDARDPLAAAMARERSERHPGVTAVTWSPQGPELLIDFEGDLWRLNGEASPVRLTRTETRESDAIFAPDGLTVHFLREGDVWTKDFEDSGGEVEPRLTTGLARDGIEITDFRMSPDGSWLAIHELDHRGVPLRGIPDYLAEETQLVEIRRAYPGEEAVRHRLGLVAPQSIAATDDEIRWLVWSDEPPDMILSYRWSPDGKRLAIDTSDLFAKDRRIFVVDLIPSGELRPRMIARDRDPFNETFYFWRIEWSNDSQLLYFLSDRIDDYHVWAVAPTGVGEPRQITRGPWAVAEMYPISGGLIVVGNQGRPEERHLYRVDPRGGEPVRISRRPGTHSPTLSPDARYAAVHFSSQSTPPELLLTSLATPGGKETDEYRVTHSPLPEFSQYPWVEAEFITFESHVDGSILHGRLTLPPDFDSQSKYPAILGSVYTDSVRNQWGGRTAHPTWGLDQYLAQEGYVLLNVDMRGSWGHGRDHRRGIRLDYGGIDIEDLESGVRFLATLGYVDMDRIGIWGSSYGGLMTTMSLFRKPHLYAAGIAGAPATNVRHALTGQMAVMMRPQNQPAEYDDSSPFLHAAGLEDPLMIIHGMRDQVVLFKDSAVLVQRLILLGKDVDFVVLPNAGHGWDNEGLAQTRFAFRKMVEFFDRHLAGE